MAKNMNKSTGQANLKQNTVSFYTETNEPILFINIFTKEALGKLKDILHKLAAGAVNEYKLHELHFFNFKGLDELNLKINHQSTKSMSVSITVQKIKSRNGRVVFDWINSINGWKDCSGLLDGIVAPGSQDLSDNIGDEAKITVSYLQEGY